MIQENVHNKKTRDFKVVDSEYIKIRHVCLYICIEEIVRKYTKNINRLLSGLQEFFFFLHFSVVVLFAFQIAYKI